MSAEAIVITALLFLAAFAAFMSWHYHVLSGVNRKHAESWRRAGDELKVLEKALEEDCQRQREVLGKLEKACEELAEAHRKEIDEYEAILRAERARYEELLREARRG